MKEYGKTLILEPEDILIYVPDIFWDGYRENMDQKEIAYLFSSIVSQRITVTYPYYDNIVFVDDDLKKFIVVKGKYLDVDKEDEEETSRFDLIEIDE
jgi:hypothetical protein